MPIITQTNGSRSLPKIITQTCRSLPNDWVGKPADYYPIMVGWVFITQSMIITPTITQSIIGVLTTTQHIVGTQRVIDACSNMHVNMHVSVSMRAPTYICCQHAHMHTSTCTNMYTCIHVHTNKCVHVVCLCLDSVYMHVCV